MKKILPNIDRRQLRQFAASERHQLLAGAAAKERESALWTTRKISPSLRRIFGYGKPAEQFMAPTSGGTAGPSIINDINAFEDWTPANRS
jgi:hypothetical protein